MSRIVIREFRTHTVELHTRVPFKYGIATMTNVPYLFLGLTVEVEGQRVLGVAADLLPPKWFTKDPAQPLDDEIAQMRRVIDAAGTQALSMAGDTAFDLWLELYRRQTVWGEREKLPPLLVHFGTSMVERALIEAIGRAHRRPFPQMLREGQLGVRLEAIHPSLKGSTVADWLPAKPLEDIIIRHTVGLGDWLTEAQIPATERLNDGLPQSLEASIRAYGLRHFKIKLTGSQTPDFARLGEIARLFEELAPPNYAFTLDGNEQFKSVDAFRLYWDELVEQDSLQSLLDHLLFVEQPLHRDVALAKAVGRQFLNWPERPPIIIDESDATLESLPLALELGYAGTSHKNCKGVFKGIANYCLLAQRQRAGADAPLLMSGEDLCTVGPVALLQDLTVMASLGIRSVERNGHHYHPGLSQFPAFIQREVLAAHSDLYCPSARTWPTLAIRDGVIQIGSLNQQPFGVGLSLESLFR